MPQCLLRTQCPSQTAVPSTCAVTHHVQNTAAYRSCMRVFLIVTT
ncbi:hypothetical protein HMPREF3190_01728 [Umbribacter vaginalis]|nr:hypothetical protein HMPREF3190_01728 [Coriobacteriales bacterium DNF00809]